MNAIAASLCEDPNIRALVLRLCDLLGAELVQAGFSGPKPGPTTAGPTPHGFQLQTTRFLVDQVSSTPYELWLSFEHMSQGPSAGYSQLKAELLRAAPRINQAGGNSQLAATAVMFSIPALSQLRPTPASLPQLVEHVTRGVHGMGEHWQTLLTTRAASSFCAQLAP